jgi:hypothetical protein
MKKHPSPSKLRIHRETLLPLASAWAMERLAGGSFFTQHTACNSIDNDCHPTLDTECVM